jgi:hypothetical protein
MTKDVLVKRFHYETHDRLRNHLTEALYEPYALQSHGRGSVVAPQ